MKVHQKQSLDHVGKSYVNMRIYGRIFNYLSIYRGTKNVLTLSVKY